MKLVCMDIIKCQFKSRRIAAAKENFGDFWRNLTAVPSIRRCGAERSNRRARSARFTVMSMCTEKGLGWPNPNQIWNFFLSTPKTKVVVLLEIGGMVPSQPTTTKSN